MDMTTKEIQMTAETFPISKTESVELRASGTDWNGHQAFVAVLVRDGQDISERAAGTLEQGRDIARQWAFGIGFDRTH